MQFIRVSLLATLMFTSIGVPAYAQGYAKDRPMVNTSHLQPVRFHQQRPFVSIEDTGPIVTDHRRDDTATPLVVPIPPRRRGGSVIVPAGAMQVSDGVFVVPASPGGVGNSNPMLGDYSYLQDAGPRSHIAPRNPLVNQNLPNGYTTGVHGAMKAWSPTSPAVAQPATARRTSPIGGTAQPVTALYSGPNASVGGSTSRSTKSNVTGRLLDKQH